MLRVGRFSMMPGTVKPVCNEHLYNEIYYLWFIQYCVLMMTEGTELLVLIISAFSSSSRWPLATYMSSRRQIGIPLGGRYRQVSLYQLLRLICPQGHNAVLYNLYILKIWWQPKLLSCGHTGTTRCQPTLSPTVTLLCLPGRAHLALILFLGIRHGVGLHFVDVIGYFPVNLTDTGTSAAVEYLDSSLSLLSNKTWLYPSWSLLYLGGLVYLFFSFVYIFLSVQLPKLFQLLNLSNIPFSTISHSRSLHFSCITYWFIFIEVLS